MSDVPLTDGIEFRFPTTEAQRLAIHAKFEYDAMTPDERAVVDRAWADRSEWELEQIRAELEFDLF